MRALGAFVGHALDLGKCAFAVAFEREWMYALSNFQSVSAMVLGTLRSQSAPAELNDEAAAASFIL